MYDDDKNFAHYPQSKTGGAAFSKPSCQNYNGEEGMSLRDWFAGQALINTELCPGRVRDHSDLKEMFGSDRTSITRAEIAAEQAYRIADAMLAARTI